IPMFFKGRAKKVVGLDYGYHHIQAVEVELKGGGARLTKWGAARMPSDAIDIEGRVLDPTLFAQGLKSALQEAGIKTRRVVTMVPAASLVVRSILMPNMTSDELYEAAKWEAAQQLPYPIEEAVYDFVPVKQKKNDQMQDTELLVLATRADQVEGIVKACQLAGLELLGIDAGPLALARAVGIGKTDISTYPPRQIIDDPLGEAAAVGYELGLDSISEAIIDLGSGTTDVSIFRDGYLRVARSFTIGGSKFDEKLAERLGVSLEEARHIKWTEAHLNADGIVPLGKDRASLIAQSIQEVAEEMLEEIQRSLDYYRAQNGWIPIDRIVVTGGGAKLSGMMEYLSNNLNSTVELANPLVNLGETDEFPANAEVYTLAVGLALWKVTRE
ncbi:MAG: type IV pilus assembly protein PilM, partial [Firmicutes bacterium]|nr:type IV pilus assembly protein PilM [Bacillota bacterium]